MRPGHLSLVDPAAAGADAVSSPELAAEELKARARLLARDQLLTVQSLLTHLTDISGAASRAGDLPLGVREMCRQISDEAKFRGQTLGALVERTMPQQPSV